MKCIALSSADLLRGEGMIVTLNEKGEEEWRWAGNVQKVSTPVIVDDLIYFTADEKTLVCLDAATGEEDQNWSLPVVASSAAPLIVDDVAYLACRGPQALAYHFDGRVLWQYTHEEFRRMARSNAGSDRRSARGRQQPRRSASARSAHGCVEASCRDWIDRRTVECADR